MENLDLNNPATYLNKSELKRFMDIKYKPKGCRRRKSSLGDIYYEIKELSYSLNVSVSTLIKYYKLGKLDEYVRKKRGN